MSEEANRPWYALLAGLAARWPHFELSVPTIRAYLATLQDLPVELVTLAAEQLAASSRFFPSAGELRLAAVELILERAEVPRPDAAWGEVVRELAREWPEHPADPECRICRGLGYLHLEVPPSHPAFGKLQLCTCRQIGPEDIVTSPTGDLWPRPRFSHPLIAEAVESLGGWFELAKAEVRESWRARFLEFYEALRRRRAGELIRPPAVAAFLDKAYDPSPAIQSLVARLESGPAERRRLSGGPDAASTNVP